MNSRIVANELVKIAKTLVAAWMEHCSPRTQLQQDAEKLVKSVNEADEKARQINDAANKAGEKIAKDLKTVPVNVKKDAYLTKPNWEVTFEGKNSVGNVYVDCCVPFETYITSKNGKYSAEHFAPQIKVRVNNSIEETFGFSEVQKAKDYIKSLFA